MTAPAADAWVHVGKNGKLFYAAASKPKPKPAPAPSPAQATNNTPCFHTHAVLSDMTKS